jgi:hypothetical protein
VTVKDLIPHSDATYRTVAAREARAVGGFTAGGLGHRWRADWIASRRSAFNGLGVSSHHLLRDLLDPSRGPSAPRPPRDTRSAHDRRLIAAGFDEGDNRATCPGNQRLRLVFGQPGALLNVPS